MKDGESSSGLLKSVHGAAAIARVVIRTLKAMAGANGVAATIAVWGYALWGRWAGLPIDDLFLACEPGLQSNSAVNNTLFALALLWALWFVTRWLQAKETGPRLFCGFMGLYGLFQVFIPVLKIFPDFTDEGDILPRPTVESLLTLDGTLALYVYCSMILFAVIGSNPAPIRDWLD